MDTRTDKLIQQAGKFIQQGKFSHALEQYLKAHQLNPGETTVLNVIGDLYVRLGKETEALLWYHKLADVLRSQELLSNASVAYKKILKLSPEDQDAMTALAKLYEEQGLGAKANQQYRLVAAGMVNRREHDAAIAIYRKICSLEPTSHQDQLRLADALEQVGNLEAASQAYLKAAQQLSKKGDVTQAVAVLENVLRIKPNDKDLVRELCALLCQLDLAARGIDYLKSVSLDADPDFKVLISETFLGDGKLDSAMAILLEDGAKDFKLYPAIVRLLQELIARKGLEGALDVAKALFETSIQRHDEITLKIMLESILALDESNIRTLKALTTLLVRMNDTQNLEGYLKRLVVAQLRAGELIEGRDNLDKLGDSRQTTDYADLLHPLNEAIAAGTHEVSTRTCQTIIQFLESGVRGNADSQPATGLALGVSELDLGLVQDEPQQEFVLEEFN
jgi:tetratricopeptide (TPR) repeat protein